MFVAETVLDGDGQPYVRPLLVVSEEDAIAEAVTQTSVPRIVHCHPSFDTLQEAQAACDEANSALTDGLLTAPQVAAALGLTPRTVRLACAKGHMAGAELVQETRGESWRIPARYADPAVYRAAVGGPGRKATT